MSFAKVPVTQSQRQTQDRALKPAASVTAQPLPASVRPRSTLQAARPQGGVASPCGV